MSDIAHRAGTPFHIRWSYGDDLSDVDITAVVSGPAGEVARLKILRTAQTGEIDLVATSAETARWPAGRLHLDVMLLRGDVSGRLDTVFIDLSEEAAA